MHTLKIHNTRIRNDRTRQRLCDSYHFIFIEFEIRINELCHIHTRKIRTHHKYIRSCYFIINQWFCVNIVSRFLSAQILQKSNDNGNYIGMIRKRNNRHTFCQQSLPDIYQYSTEIWNNSLLFIYEFFRFLRGFFSFSILFSSNFNFIFVNRN